ncbi:MAG: ATP-binding cassette domain-containing protein [Candidatus Hodarchaeales archaeon]|jgi:ABC-type lipoprotein export system ATPase subunit
MSSFTRKIFYDPTEELPDDLLVGLFSVYKIFQSKKLEHVALRGISLSLREKEMASCVGPSGSGKTTLLNILAGLLTPSAGTVYWKKLNSAISHFTTSQLATVRNEFLGYLSQQPFLLPQINVLKNVMFPGMIRDRSSSNELKSNALDLLSRVGLLNKAYSSPNTLSAGEVQRVALASSLINDPDIVFADEPTGNLDFQTGEQFLDLLEEVNNSLGTAFFIVTHSSQVAKRTDSVFELSDGMLIGHHTVANLAALHSTRTIVPDAQNRIFLPNELLETLGSPWGFSVDIDNTNDQKRLVLNPIAVEDIDPSEILQKEIACQLCGEKTPSINRFCDHCGSFLSQFSLEE